MTPSRRAPVDGFLMPTREAADVNWSIQQPVLVIAPHLTHPQRNGADISIERYSRYLSLHCDFVDLVGADTLRRYVNGRISSEERFPGKPRSKWFAAVRTVLLQSHYTREKFNTAAVRRTVRRQLGDERYGALVASYVTTTELVPRTEGQARLFVWTHNDEFQYFEDLLRTLRSWPGRLAAWQSLRWLRRRIAYVAAGSVLLHVTAKDQLAFDRHVPGHASMVVPIGTDIDDADKGWPAPDGRVRLTYVGSLNVQMATDALTHFAKTFFPVLQTVFGSRLSVQVVGSSPSTAVRDLCSANRWECFHDVSDERLSEILVGTTFTILPFSYATGIKLKLVRTLGSGTPFLATLACRPEGFVEPVGCCFSNDPAIWVQAIQTWMQLASTDKLRSELIAFARAHSWEAAVMNFVHQLKSEVKS